MNNKQRIISAAALLVALITLLAVPAGAVKSYQTYTYSSSGFALYSPDAYTPVTTVDSNYIGLDAKKGIEDPRDLYVDDEDNVYIADAKNNRIIVCDRYYKLKYIISEFTNEQGVPDNFTNPSGVFVTKDRIFVCDTDANRIVTFNRDGEFLAVIPEPEDEILEDDSVYKPVALAVDDYNRLYVVSSTTYQGIIVMSDTGEFICIIGAQKVSISAWDKVWRKIMSDTARAQQERIIPTEYNNIAIRDKLIYVTTSSLDSKAQQNAIKTKSKKGDYAPVKLLNNSGDEVMKRNGFYPPSGEVDVGTSKTDGSKTGPSKVTDVAVGPEKTWSIIDENRSKVFTYDFNGNLLFAFGDEGTQLGNMSKIAAVVYKSDGTMLLLDKSQKSFTVYQRTEYGDILINALKNQNERQFDRAIEDWTEILKRNSNFDTAYIGIGQAYSRNGNYKEALKYYEAAYDNENWSDAYKEIRKEWISKYILLIPVIAAAIITAVVLFFKYAGKVNKRAATAGGKRTFGEELLYGFHLIFHPFDGFWDLKHEHRGSLRAALVYVAAAVLTFFYQAIGSGYLVNPHGSYTTIVSQAISVIVPLMLWVVANWCLTTLFDGEGSFKDIFIACSYSLLPLVLLIIPATIYSNFATTAELDVVSFVGTVAFIWAGLLIFTGMMVTHDYTLGKNFIISLSTIVGMGFIMFIGILFTTLLGKIISFVSNIIVEINYRM